MNGSFFAVVSILSSNPNLLAMIFDFFSMLVATLLSILLYVLVYFHVMLLYTSQVSYGRNWFSYLL